MHYGNLRLQNSALVLVCLMFVLSFPDTSVGKGYILEIKPYAKIVGPDILLKDICLLKPESEALQKKVALVYLGKAAPPSESKDISLSYIRLQLRRAGLLEYFDTLKGPRIIRVTTAHKDITRLRIKEAVVEAFENNFENKIVILDPVNSYKVFCYLVEKNEKNQGTIVFV